MSEIKVTYFDKPGPDNTDATLRLAKQRADELGIDTIVVATTFGNTGVKATEVFKGKKVVLVTHFTGFTAPNEQQATRENIDAIKRNGGIVHTASHAFTGVGGAMRKKFNTYDTDDLVSSVFRIFGQGMKVCAEISLMAADAGLVPVDRDVIAVAGTGRGADTAVVLQPANLRDFFDLRIKEVLCKPRL
jgi:hypothetical protein